MSQKLPTHGFKWLNNLTNQDVIKLLEKRDTNIGCIFEVDLEYPEEIWKSHNDYRLAPEKLKIDNVELIGSFIQSIIMFYIIKILNNVLNRV